MWMGAGFFGGSSPRVWGTPAPTSHKPHKSRFIPTGVGNTIANPLGLPLPAVHPHGCGEHMLACMVTSFAPGSSPRVWGTLLPWFVGLALCRFIPTGVGNTRGTWRTHNGNPVHPHGCGEHALIISLISPIGGSSPRVWGTLCFPPSAALFLRFIPTGVGNTLQPYAGVFAGAVHPHGCGEHHHGVIKSYRFAGSSPRVWGTQIFIHQIRTDFRFIPTGVGNTISINRPGETMPVHPHGCGEHHRPTLPPRVFPGSSPRVWGTQFISVNRREKLRFIPTGVGNTVAGSRGFPFLAVHPHGCGEHQSTSCPEFLSPGSSPRVWGTRIGKGSAKAEERFIPTGVGNTTLREQGTAIGNGSSPRVWGTRYQPPRRRSPLRFIPTGVGNTFCRKCPAAPPPVHPHGCGEHRNTHKAGCCAGGSSPRVWGTHPRRGCSAKNRRFIPTGVGNTVSSACMAACCSVHPHGCGEHFSRQNLMLVASGSSPRVWGTPA